MVPLVTAASLLVVVFWRTRMMYREHARHVSTLQQDLDTVDQQILKFGAGINQNQEKLRETNRRLTEDLFRQQMEFAAVELVGLWVSDSQSNLSIPMPQVIGAYLTRVRPGILPSLPGARTDAGTPGTAQPPPTSAPGPGKAEGKPQKENSPEAGGKTAQAPKAAAGAPSAAASAAGGNNPAPAPARPMTPDAILAEQVARWCAEHDASRNTRVIEWMERFSRNAVLGVEDRKLFLVAHDGMHQHRIVWATEPQYVGQSFPKVMKSLYQAFVSENYMRSFFRFQKGEMSYRPLFQMEYAGEIGYTDAKYTLSRQWYNGLIPLYGTNLSLGVSSPLTHDFIQALDAAGEELDKIGEGLGKLDSDLRAADASLMLLKRSFRTSGDAFLRTLLLVLVLTSLVLVGSAFVLLRFVRRDLILPLLRMRETAKKVCRGDLDERCRIDSRDESGELAECIDQLAEKARLLVQSEQDRQRVQKDILHLLDVVSRASSGDLTVRGAVSTDEMQAVVDAFNHMMNSIGTLVIRVRNAGIQVEQMSRRLLDYSRQILEKSQRQIQDLDIASRKIRALGDRSQEITRMVEQIGTIAMETNTLALNASLEAARAGKHDAGIGHLAEHVRQLADGLNKTKQDIESFIGSIQLATNYAVSSVEEVLRTSQQTTSEAEQSYHTAELTSTEAAHLGDAISRFKVKTVEDKEREQRVFRELSFVAYSLSEIRRILREMDSNEYERLHDTLSTFASQLKSMGVEEKPFEDQAASGAEGEVPAILPEPSDGE